MKLASAVAERIDRALGIDLRSLAVFRILVGLLLLADLAGRSGDLVAHYTDDGVLPRSLLAESAWTSEVGYQFRWSLHMISGRVEVQALLFLVAAAFALSMALGYRTRLATVVSWAMLVSLHSRNHVVLDGGDIALRCVMFWAMFLPLGARLSVDAWRRPPLADDPPRVLTVATTAYLLQVALVYFFSAGHKDSARWTSSFTAVYYALSLDVFVTPLGRWLLNFPILLKFLTAATMFLEWVGPVIAFVPARTPWLRIGTVLAFWSFHGGLILGMELGIFPLIMIVAWIPFLPGVVWDAPIRWTAGIRSHLAHLDLDPIARRLFPRPERPRPEMRATSILLVSFLLPYIILWNLREWNEERWSVMPASWNRVARFTGLDQRWDMFAPYPTVDDGWFVMRGVLRDRTVVDLWTMSAGISQEKPDRVSHHYVNQRWRKYLVNLYDRSYIRLRQPFGQWLRMRWDGTFADPDEWRKVEELEVVFHRERTPAPGDPPPKIQPVQVHFWKFR